MNIKLVFVNVLKLFKLKVDFIPIPMMYVILKYFKCFYLLINESKLYNVLNVAIVLRKYSI